MAYDHIPRSVALLVIAISFSVAAACGGGNDKPPATETGGATQTSSSSGSTSNGEGAQMAKAGLELSEYSLLDKAGYSAALGEPVSIVEDDGVVPNPYGCEGAHARVLTGAGVI